MVNNQTFNKYGRNNSCENNTYTRTHECTHAFLRKRELTVLVYDHETIVTFSKAHQQTSKKNSWNQIVRQEFLRRKKYSQTPSKCRSGYKLTTFPGTHKAIKEEEEPWPPGEGL